jgi:hypothetical protein
MPRLPKWLVNMRIDRAEASTDWDGSNKRV